MNRRKLVFLLGYIYVFIVLVSFGIDYLPIGLFSEGARDHSSYTKVVAGAGVYWSLFLLSIIKMKWAILALGIAFILLAKYGMNKLELDR